MKFKVVFKDPFKRLDNDLETNYIEKENMIELFEKVPWAEHWAKLETDKHKEFRDPPSLSIVNETNNTELVLDAFDNQKWRIIYVRPKPVKKFFGLITKMNNGHLSLAESQTITDVKNCLQAFIGCDLQYMEDFMK